MGWASKTNGELLVLAAADVDVFLTSGGQSHAIRLELYGDNAVP
jgi:hypothetical protein